LPYAGDLLVFYGEDLYEDPELGWGELARGGIATYAVPGHHDNNRDAMREPHVAYVAERLRAYLDGGDSAPASTPPMTASAARS
jgi:hypothetical protein